VGLEDLPGKIIYEYDDIRGAAHAVPVSNVSSYHTRIRKSLKTSYKSIACYHMADKYWIATVRNNCSEQLQ
jgi:hypothetical protein